MGKYLEIIDKEILTLFKDEHLSIKRNEIVDFVSPITQQIKFAVRDEDFSEFRLSLTSLFKILDDNEYTYCPKLDSSYRQNTFDFYSFRVKIISLLKTITAAPRHCQQSLDRFLELMEIHKKTLNYLATLANLKKEKRNIIISNRTASWNKRGWNAFGTIFKIADELEGKIFKNFGYGNSSYFYFLLTYKGIPITTFTDYIKYEFVGAYQIIRYTKKYHYYNFKIDEYQNVTKNVFLNYNGWENIMSYVLELSNIGDADRELYFYNYINREFTTMVNGLEQMYHTNHFEFYKNSELDGSIIENTYVVGLDERLLSYKSEKIFGTLEFFSKFNNSFVIQNKESISKLFKLYELQLPDMLREKNHLVDLIPIYEKNEAEAAQTFNLYIQNNLKINLLLRSTKSFDELTVEEDRKIYEEYEKKKDKLNDARSGLNNLKNTIRKVDRFAEEYREATKNISS